jgi:hypothetical protein
VHASGWLDTNGRVEMATGALGRRGRRRGDNARTETDRQRLARVGQLERHALGMAPVGAVALSPCGLSKRDGEVPQQRPMSERRTGAGPAGSGWGGLQRSEGEVVVMTNKRT